jgi:acetyl esterase/lipase
MPAASPPARLRWAFVLALAALAPALATVLPPPHLLVMAFGLLGAELMPWLALLALAAVALAARPVSGSRLRLAALALAAAALAIAIRQLAMIPAALAAADGELARVVGTAPLPAGMPARPLGWSGWFAGVGADGPVLDGSVVIPAADGTPLAARFHHPLPAGPYPLVVMIHGGGWSGGSADEFAPYGRALASHGFAVVSIDYRRAPAHRFPAQLDDVRAALAWLRAHADGFAADPARIALIGRSAGAHLALLAAYGGEPVQAVIAYYSPIDLVAGYRDPPRPDPLHVRRLMEGFIGGDPDSMEGAYLEASPITHAHGAQPPTLLISGGRDHAIVEEGTRRMVAALRGDGDAVAWITIPWSEHAFDLAPQGLAGRIAHWHAERFLHWALDSPR